MLGLALKHAQAFSNQPFEEPSIKTCPEPESNQRHEDFQSSALPTELSGHRLYKSLSCGSRIWTCDLRVMSPTSFQTAPSRDIKLNSHKRKADDRTRTDNLLITNQLLCQLSHIGASLQANGWRWIRTTEALSSRFTVCPLWPLGNPPITQQIFNCVSRWSDSNR